MKSLYLIFVIGVLFLFPHKFTQAQIEVSENALEANKEFESQRAQICVDGPEAHGEKTYARFCTSSGSVSLFKGDVEKACKAPENREKEICKTLQSGKSFYRNGQTLYSFSNTQGGSSIEIQSTWIPSSKGDKTTIFLTSSGFEVNLQILEKPSWIQIMALANEALKQKGEDATLLAGDLSDKSFPVGDKGQIFKPYLIAQVNQPFSSDIKLTYLFLLISEKAGVPSTELLENPIKYRQGGDKKFAFPLDEMLWNRVKNTSQIRVIALEETANGEVEFLRATFESDSLSQNMDILLEVAKDPSILDELKE